MHAKVSTVLVGNSYVNMFDAVRSKASRRTYNMALRLYCDFTLMDTDRLIDLALKDLQAAIGSRTD
ncbi:MAG: hypothetical protein V3T40_04830 [Nitrososphaerales archaeon]